MTPRRLAVINIGCIIILFFSFKAKFSAHIVSLCKLNLISSEMLRLAILVANIANVSLLAKHVSVLIAIQHSSG